MSPLAAARRAQAVALRAQADALDLEAIALDGAPAADEILSAKNWPTEIAAVATWRRARDAARRGELAMTGRPPVVRRSEVMRWLESIPVRTTVPSEDKAPAPRSKAARRALAEAEYRRDAGMR
jgi:hypothetical protein